MNVDEFVASRILVELQPVVAMIRELMHEEDPEAIEEMSYGLPVYKGRKIFAFISPTKKDITFSFTHGGEFEDKFNLLRGRGKMAKHVRINNLHSISRDMLRYYIRQAVDLDKR